MLRNISNILLSIYIYLFKYLLQLKLMTYCHYCCSCINPMFFFVQAKGSTDRGTSTDPPPSPKMLK